MISNSNNKGFTVDKIIEHMANEINNNCGQVRGSSASFVFPNFPRYLAYDIGIILDINKCECQLMLMFAYDAGIKRIDIKGRNVWWDKDRKTYIALDHKHNYQPVETAFEGSVTSPSTDRCESIPSLKSRMVSHKNDLSHNGWMNFSDVATNFGFWCCSFSQ